MQHWKEIEFADVPGGMSTNTVNSGQKFAKRVLNLHNHIKPGALVLRPGYELLYDKPLCQIKDNQGRDIILDAGFINFDVFFDRQADEKGKEITCLIQKVKLRSLMSDDNYLDMLCFWIRPYWNGEVWIDEWQWLNQTIITKITVGADILYPNKINIYGSSINGLSDDSLNNYVIYNKTKEQYARIITSKINNENEIRICHSLYNNQWQADDIVIISKYWIDVDVLSELFKTSWEDITFYKVVNDLRIAFGGYRNRPGISIGYRKKYFQIRKFDFQNVHPDLNEDGIIEKFSKIDGIVLDTHILNNNYSIKLNAIEGGNLPAGDYTIRLTGIIDNYEEQLLAENNIQVDNNSTIEVIPIINYAKINPRITGYGIYYSNDGITFYKLTKYNITDKSYAAGNWKIDEFGNLTLISTIIPSENQILELHSEQNAVSNADINNSGTWQTFGGGELEISQDAVDNYSIKFKSDLFETLPEPDYRTGLIFPVNATKGKLYDISVYIKSTTDKIYGMFLGDSLKVLNRTQTPINVNNTYSQYKFNVLADDITESPKYFALGIYPAKDIFVSAGEKVYKSTNGINWNLSNTGLSQTEFYDIVNFGFTLYAIGGGNLYKSINGGISWQQVTGLSNISAIKVLNNQIFLGLEDGKVYNYNGNSFTLLSDDIQEEIMTFIKASNDIYAGTFGGGVYKSSDNGITWQQVNNGLTSDIIVLYEKDGILFAGTFGDGIFRSSDGGANWTQINNGFPALIEYDISSITSKGNYLFVSLYDGGNNTDAGIYRSDDNGDNWEEVNNGITNLDIYSLYVFGDKILAGGGNGEIFYTTDDGNNWQLAATLDGLIYFPNISSYHEFYIDKVSIKEKNVTVFNEADFSSTEMSAELGYTPTFNYVKGWDQAIAFRGRTYYLNPYVDKRYENFILVSHIHSSGAFMYDIATFSNFRELERFDSNEAIGMALLPTMDLLILKDNSVMIIEPETGMTREPIFGVSCIARNSIVNMNGIIYWCGGEDIYLFENNQIKRLLKETIRDIYIKNISTKKLIQAVRDKYNSYRIRTWNPETKFEYLLTENGWVEEKKYNFPEIYRVGFRNKLYFLSAGNIYTEIIELDYNAFQDFIMTGEFVLDSGIEVETEL